MQRLEAVLRLVLFVICSLVGIAAVGLAVLAPEWNALLQIKEDARQIARNNDKIEQIIQDHQILTAQIAADPNILTNIASITLGIDANEPNMPPAVRLTTEKLKLAKNILAGQDNPQDYKIPKWLQRSGEKQNRIILFISGAGLLIISLVCFGKPKCPAHQKTVKS